MKTDMTRRCFLGAAAAFAGGGCRSMFTGAKRDYDDLSYYKAAWPQDGEGFFRVSVSDGREFTLTPFQYGTGWGVDGRSDGEFRIEPRESAYYIFVRNGGVMMPWIVRTTAEQTLVIGTQTVTIRAFAPDGKSFEQVEITQGGSMKEIISLPHFKNRRSSGSAKTEPDPPAKIR